MNALKILMVFFILAASLHAYKLYAVKKGIYDIPSERSSHTRPVIRGGGIIFVLAVLMAVFAKYRAFLTPKGLAFITGFLLLSFTGFLDDKKNLTPQVRFPFQVVSAILILYAAGLWESTIPLWLQLTAFVVAIGFINAYNFMDGINGITGLYSIVLILTLWYLNRLHALVPDTIFLYLLIALLIFGYFNFRKQALMFAGDVGSMSLAAVLLFLLSKFMIELQSPALLLTVVVYGVDSAMTIIFRLLQKENIFRAHRWHVYQKMVDRYGLSHLQTALIYALLQAIINSAIILTRAYALPLKTQEKIIFLSILFLVFIYIFIQKDKLLKKEPH